MDMLLKFVGEHLLPALESAFMAHEPEMQDALIKEVSDLVAQVGGWIEDKMHGKVA